MTACGSSGAPGVTRPQKNRRRAGAAPKAGAGLRVAGGGPGTGGPYMSYPAIPCQPGGWYPYPLGVGLGAGWAAPIGARSASRIGIILGAGRGGCLGAKENRRCGTPPALRPFDSTGSEGNLKNPALPTGISPVGAPTTNAVPAEK